MEITDSKWEKVGEKKWDRVIVNRNVDLLEK